MKQSIFRAYDIRGIYPKELNEAIAADVAVALARHFRKNAGGEREPTIVVGRDARLSAPKLYRAIVRALKTGNSKLKILPAGLITTPMLTFLVNDMRADGGIMITASHNPKEYNGMKIVKQQGIPMSGKEIETLLKKFHPKNKQSQ